MMNRFLSGLTPAKDGRELFGPLQQEIERVFDEFTRSLPVLSNFPRQGISLKVDVSETDKDVEVTAEIPGVDAKDIDVQLNDNILTIRGEKRGEKEEMNKNYHVSERTYGSFLRSFALPAEVDDTKVDAKFVNGTLTVVLPKSSSAQTSSRKIVIKSA